MVGGEGVGYVDVWKGDFWVERIVGVCLFCLGSKKEVRMISMVIVYWLS